MRALAAMILVVLSALAGAVACSRDDGAGEPGKRYFAYLYTTRDNNSSILHPYPPLHSTWNFAIDITDESLRVPATFVAETNVLNEYSFLNQQDDERYRMRVSSEASHGKHYKPRVEITFPITGGETHRVVGVERVSRSEVAVTICEYMTPGVFRRSDDGNLERPSGYAADYRVQTHTVELTKRQDGFGNYSPEPRWLVTDIQGTQDWDYQASVCEPFKPDPFVVAPPQPR